MRTVNTEATTLISSLISAKDALSKLTGKDINLLILSADLFKRLAFECKTDDLAYFYGMNVCQHSDPSETGFMMRSELT